MANTQMTLNVGHVGFQRDNPSSSETATLASKPLKKYTNLIGAVLSVSLIAGVGVWGYKLIMRDVTGIPVVRAAEGQMRERPEEPGGQLALHQGLAVNEVAADGQASGPVDRLVLAPKPAGLKEEDQPISVEVAAPVQQPDPLAGVQTGIPVDTQTADDAGSDVVAEATTVPQAAPVQQPAPLDVAAALETGDIDAIVAELSNGAGQIEASPLGEEATTPEVQAVVTPVARPAVYTGPGLKLSKRPQLRPLGAIQRPTDVTPVAAVAEVAASGPKEVDGANLPVGTRLVQLGALDTPENARAHWDKLATKFGDYMQDKDRVIIKASSGGRDFYRLRAVGFTDLADARRFCSALVAEGADCIPVVTR